MSDTSDALPSRSPQDPYTSFLVAASAGSGKTYQLSRRFLHLVGAGANPAAILTVTFTKKAAGEMRSRILEEAARLTAQPEAQQRFEQESAEFFAAARARGLTPPPRRRAADVGRRILAQSQSLSISTIDSLFADWLRKFPYEASPEAELAELRPQDGADDTAQSDDQSAPAFPSPFALLGPLDERELSELAWAATCRFLARALGDDSLPAAATAGKESSPWATLLAQLPAQDIRAARQRLEALDRLETYLWHAERQTTDGNALAAHDALGSAGEQSELDVLEQLATPLTSIAASVASDERRAAFLEAIGARDLSLLVSSGLVTRTYGISGQFVRGKKREALAAEITTVETGLRAHLNARRRRDLGRQGEALYALFRLYRQLRDHLKFKRGSLEFRDLTKGAYRLFRGDAGLGARLLLARTVRHVMLDEFQDTSRLQWAIFAEMAQSMLAGAGLETDEPGPEPSVFIVGDAKQSIYGFREADPTVMGEVAPLLGERLQLAPLNASYRTAQVVLDFVNEVFGQSALTEFPRHVTASAGTGAPFVPDVGRVLLAPLVTGRAHDAGDHQAPETPDAAQTAETSEAQEAELVAATIHQALSGAVPYPVYDKEQQSFRPLRASDVAILYRSTTKAALFEQALRRRGIASQREEERGFFARPEIRDAMALLRYLALPADLIALCTVLRSPLAGISDASLLDLLADTTALRHEVSRPSQLLARLAGVDPALAHLLQDLQQRTGMLLPHALLAQALARLDAFAAYGRDSLYKDLPPDVATATEAPLARRNLIRLLELLLRFEDEGVTSLTAVLRRLESLAATDEIGNAAVAADAVTLMTIHKAKGLEYPFVAVVDTGRPWGRKDLHWLQTRHADGLPLVTYIGRDEDRPVGDPHFDRLLADAEAQIAEECQRLLYVALTRARQYLLVTGHQPHRRVGIAETVPYDALQAALARRPEGRDGAVLTIERTPLLTWSAGIAIAAATTTGTVTKKVTLPGHAALSLPKPQPDLPREIHLVSPSRHEPATLPKRRAGALTVVPWGADARTATGIGRFLHAGLEAYMRDLDFDRALAWSAMVGGLNASLVNDVYRCLDTALMDPALRDLRQRAVRLETELSLVHQVDEGTLMRGTLDLLVELPGRQLLVVDYKATRFTGIPHDMDLARFAAERGWSEQLQAYAAALKALYPDTEVRTAVYFVTLTRLISVDPVTPD